MNYNMPYYSMFPSPSMPLKATSGGIFKRLLGGLNFGSILDNTQKTLNLVNQTIPMIKQAGPLVKNAKTMFKVVSEFNKPDSPKVTNIPNNINSSNNVNLTNNGNVKKVTNNFSDNGPVFFLK